MSKFVKIFLQLLFIASGITAREPYRWFASNKEIARHARLASCVNSTARSLFDSGNRLAIICKKCGPLDNTIARLLMKEDPVLLVNKSLNFTNERMRSYVIIGNETALDLHKHFLHENSKFSPFFEYLIVFMQEHDSIRNLSRDMWQFGYRYFAFLLFHDDTDHGEIVMPGLGNNSEFALEIQKVCVTTNGKNSLTPFYKHMCLFEKCILSYGGVSDETVRYWRSEDKFGIRGLGTRFVERYGRLYNIVVDTNVSRDLNWSEATRLLDEDKVDIVNGLIPDNIDKYESLQILCWYMFRYMAFTSRVQYRNLNEMLQLLMPFHYSVWIFIACLSISYIFLIYVLKRLWQASLISEYIRFIDICYIVLTKGVPFPKKSALRFVLVLWMIFSLYFNIIYNSTFTSSLARVHDEILLKDLEDLWKSNQPFGGPNIVVSSLNDTSKQYMADLRNRYQVMTSEEALHGLYSKNLMTVVQQFTIDKLNWVHRANKSLRIYTLPEPILYFPVLFFTRKGHPYTRTFQQTAARTRETGLLDRWYKDKIIDEDKRLAKEADDGILTMRNLYSIFQLFFVCTGITLFTFILELLCYNLQKVFRRVRSTSKLVRFAHGKRDSSLP